MGSWCDESLRSGKMGTTDTVRGYYVLLVKSNGSHFLTARSPKMGIWDRVRDYYIL